MRGSGGGPFGRAGSAWDVETYECVRCGGRGYLVPGAEAELAKSAPRPGIVKAAPPRVGQEAEKKRKTGA